MNSKSIINGLPLSDITETAHDRAIRYLNEYLADMPNAFDDIDYIRRQSYFLGYCRAMFHAGIISYEEKGILQDAEYLQWKEASKRFYGK
jgi:hypothetical protein